MRSIAALHEHESIFIAPPSQRPVLAALTDLSQAGLVAPFHWLESVPDLDAPGVRQLPIDPHLVTVRGGEVVASRYSRVVNRHGLTTLRLVVVVPVGHPAQDALTAHTELRYLNLGVSSAAHREPIRVLIPWSAEPLSADLGHQGWSNVMLSPESTADPGFTALAWWANPESIPGAAAIGLAVQAGIAGSVTEAPNDGQGGSVSTAVRVVRSFVRQTDAHAVEDDLRSRVMHIDGTLPQPVRADTNLRIPAYDDPEVRVTETAQAWYQRHSSSLRRKPIDVPAAGEGRTMSFGQALQLFFSFMIKALLGAPGDWLRSQIRSAKASIAASVGQMVFGEGSAITVVVGGVDANGRNAGWRELVAAAQTASQGMPDASFRQAQPRPRDFAALWQDLLSGARALADGSGFDKLGLGVYEGYIPQRDTIAPARDGDGSFVMTQSIGSYPAGTVLHAWDHLEIERVVADLVALSTVQGPQAQAAYQTAQAITQWQKRGMRRYLPLIGFYITSTFDQTRKDIAELVERLRVLLAEDIDAQMERRQRRLALIMRVLAAVLVIVLLGAAFLGVLGKVDWLVVALVCLGTLLIWGVTALVTFMTQQREVFRLIFQARAREEQLPVINANLCLAVEDLASLGEAYAQFDRWASVLTSFLSDPLGDRGTARTAQEHVTQLPVPIQRVVVHADADAVANTAAELRAAVFTVGWISDAWGAMGAFLKDDLSPDQLSRLNARQLEIFAEPGSPGSALSNWATGLETKGVRSTLGDSRWQRCLKILGSANGPDLRLTAATPDGGARLVVDYRQDLSESKPGEVVTDLFDVSARMGQERWTTSEGHWFREQHDGMSATMVLADATAPIRPEGFVFHPSSGGEHAAEPDDVDAIPPLSVGPLEY